MKWLRRLLNLTDEPEESVVLDPIMAPEPQTADEYQSRGYAFYTVGDYVAAEADFKQAVSLDPEDVDALFALGLARKMQGRVEDARMAFQKVIQLIEAGVLDNAMRAEMLRRLALGHVNNMTKGDWDLEKEIWKRKD